MGSVKAGTNCQMFRRPQTVRVSSISVDSQTNLEAKLLEMASIALRKELERYSVGLLRMVHGLCICVNSVHTPLSS